MYVTQEDIFLKKITYSLVVVAVTLFLFTMTAHASHAWSKYHWNMSTDQSTLVPLELGNNTSFDWYASLALASSEWNKSVLQNAIATGGSNANCDPTSGRVEVCNGLYGDNGWLGLASVWVKRGRSGHITQGVVQLNDTYFSLQQYNTSPWRNMVMCQELAHTFALTHQDEDFTNANLGSCNDYTNDPDGTIYGQMDNQYPNPHDYDMMVDIYAHLNSTDSGGNTGGKPGKCSPWPSCKNGSAKMSKNIDHNNPSSWGRAVRQDARGKNSVFVKELKDGTSIITYVTWIK